MNQSGSFEDTAKFDWILDSVNILEHTSDKSRQIFCAAEDWTDYWTEFTNRFHF